MKSTPLTLILLVVVLPGSLTAQILRDDFGDGFRNVSLWDTPKVWEGAAELLEQNERLELSAGVPVGPEFENLISQPFRETPSFNQFWQVQMVVSIDDTQFTLDDQLASFSIGIGNSSDGDEFLELAYGAGQPAGETERQVLAWWMEDETNPDGDFHAVFQALPQAITLRVAYDPNLRLIRMFHDDDTDQHDGEWTLFASFTIDGTDGTALGATTLDWEMSSTDTFQIELNGDSTNAAVAAGSAWIDDFECTLGRTLLTPTIDEDFDDNTRDEMNWHAPDLQEGTTAQWLEQNERLEFSAEAVASGDENLMIQGIKQAPSYDQPWQVEMLASIDKANFSDEDEDGSLAIVVTNPSSDGAQAVIGIAGAVLGASSPPIQALFFEAGHSSDHEAVEDFITAGIPQTVGLRVTYDPGLRVLRFYYALGPGLGDSGWTLYQAVTIDGTGDLDWGMTEFDSFEIHVRGHSNGAAIAGGSAWVDDFAFNLGSTARGEPGIRGFDDFNDDSRDPLWNEPVADSGNPSLEEVNHRLEFTAGPAGEEHEMSQWLGGGFAPQFNQAFEIRTDVHCQPEATLGDDQGGVLEVILAVDSGGNDLVLSVGSYKPPGQSIGPLIAVSNNAVVPAPPLADKVLPGALPELVGLRMTWDPDTAILRCHTDTDGDPSVETWVLLADYNLDDRAGAEFRTDWGMSDTDRFRIGLNGLAAGISIAPGEAYFDNTQIIIEPVPAGYALWVLDIPDESLRDADDDASGNGIPNLLQYMYGLPPLSTDTDVRLRARSESGVLIMTHGFNPTASDYLFSYHQKPTLDGNQWTEVAPVAINREFESGGKSFREVALPIEPGKKFLRVEVTPSQ